MILGYGTSKYYHGGRAHGIWSECSREERALRLFQVDLNGYRRFVNASIDLRERMVAVVGPNEAGKSSLLHALQSLGSNTVIPGIDRTRRLEMRDDQDVITARFLIEEGDLAGLGVLALEQHPRWYVVTKKANGRLVHRLDPKVTKDKSARRKACKTLERLLQTKTVSHFLAAHSEEIPESAEDEEEASARPLGDQLEELHEALGSHTEQLPNEVLALLKGLAQEIDELQDTSTAKVPPSLLNAADSLTRLVEVEEAMHPEERILAFLDGRTPQFLLFSEEDRNLQSEYPIQDLADPPPALKNLLQLAELSQQAIQTAISRNDHGHRASLEEKANDLLKEKFLASWTQSEVYPRIKIDTDVIRILVRSADSYSSITERSDGLRAFVALFAYVAPQSQGGVRPILLIDEAEQHLHYDAQVDLIQVFSRQEIASQVIYTTHSAAALPLDLGTGVRVATPILAEDGSDTGRSQFSNSFWDDGVGFSPLLLAMGASILAFAPTRRAVIAEGPSETMLAPSLFREALDEETLSFQVAPGLARVSPSAAHELDLEAPKVAYLVDGDDGGRRIKKKLKKAGVPESRIASLEDGFVLEDYISLELLTFAVNEVLRRSHGKNFQIEEGTLPDKGSMRALKAWCEEQGISPPKRMAVALELLEHRDNRSLLRPERRQSLSEVHRKLESALGQ